MAARPQQLLVHAEAGLPVAFERLYNRRTETEALAGAQLAGILRAAPGDAGPAEAQAKVPVAVQQIELKLGAFRRRPAGQDEFAVSNTELDVVLVVLGHEEPGARLTPQPGFHAPVGEPSPACPFLRIKVGGCITR